MRQRTPYRAVPDAFRFRRDYMLAAETLDQQSRLSFYEAVFRYAYYNELPDDGQLSPAVQALFNRCAPDLASGRINRHPAGSAPSWASTAPQGAAAPADDGSCIFAGGEEEHLCPIHDVGCGCSAENAQ